MKSTTIKVEGMHCEGCENRIKNSLELIDNVEKVECSYKTKEVKVFFEEEINEEEIIESIEDLGFEIQG